jgi:hypothetical protein
MFRGGLRYHVWRCKRGETEQIRRDEKGNDGKMHGFAWPRLPRPHMHWIYMEIKGLNEGQHERALRVYSFWTDSSERILVGKFRQIYRAYNFSSNLNLSHSFSQSIMSQENTRPQFSVYQSLPFLLHLTIFPDEHTGTWNPWGWPITGCRDSEVRVVVHCQKWSEAESAQVSFMASDSAIPSTWSQLSFKLLCSDQSEIPLEK